MAFYDLPKQERIHVVAKMSNDILSEIESGKFKNTFSYFADEDTYIRKSAYLSIGRLYFSNKRLQPKVIQMLDIFLLQDDFKIRQTVINAAVEIGKRDFGVVQLFLIRVCLTHIILHEMQLLVLSKKWDPRYRANCL
ncbi:hypothetical protein [Agriterribacter sp.]|uniref:hypothetical protein n=1 Tax=Agriterribacter sp. TaxID=2821509 RepID=UPI002C96D355|nr:hypothetical protein [Agriterribacter sp.]HRO46928.1 hypothetical protein [Agriterribacter sp.]HRQ17422.1 hypothetical protein [Agriterribacter sp.]